MGKVSSKYEEYLDSVRQNGNGKNLSCQAEILELGPRRKSYGTIHGKPSNISLYVHMVRRCRTRVVELSPHCRFRIPNLRR